MEESPWISHTSFLPLEWSEITHEFKIKAEKEINESEQKREKGLKEIKDLIQGKKNLNADTSDDFLLKFLRARKFNSKNAFSLLSNYYEHRIRFPNIYCNYSAKACGEAMLSNIANYLPYRNAHGCAIWIIRVGAWNPENVSLEELLKMSLLCQEKVLQNPITQINGIVSVIDTKGLSWSHLLHLPWRDIRCIVSTIQNSFPLRHKAIHVINNSVLFSTLFALAKPLLNQKMRKRIFFHGESYNSLHQYLPPSILPEELGGTNGPFGNSKFYSELLKSDKEFAELLSYGYIT